MFTNIYQEDGTIPNMEGRRPHKSLVSMYAASKFENVF